MRVIDRAARLAIHARDLAVLVLVVGEDALEVADQQRLAGLLQDDGPELVENLPLVEAELAVAARVRDRLVEMFEHDVLLRQLLLLRCRALRLLGRGRDRLADLVDERLQVRCLAVRGDRAIGRGDVDYDVVTRPWSGCPRSGGRDRSRICRCPCRRRGSASISPVTGVRFTSTLDSRMSPFSLGLSRPGLDHERDLGVRLGAAEAAPARARWRSSARRRRRDRQSRAARG